MINSRLKRKVAIVTGGNHGIGAATAKALAAEGVLVFINYLRLESNLCFTNFKTPGEAL